MASLESHYIELYTRIPPEHRFRYWIQLSHCSREEYTRIESMLAKVAHLELNFRILFKPSAK